MIDFWFRPKKDKKKGNVMINEVLKKLTLEQHTNFLITYALNVVTRSRKFKEMVQG